MKHPSKHTKYKYNSAPYWKFVFKAFSVNPKVFRVLARLFKNRKNTFKYFFIDLTVVRFFICDLIDVVQLNFKCYEKLEAFLSWSSSKNIQIECEFSEAYFASNF